MVAESGGVDGPVPEETVGTDGLPDVPEGMLPVKYGTVELGSGYGAVDPTAEVGAVPGGSPLLVPRPLDPGVDEVLRGPPVGPGTDQDEKLDVNPVLPVDDDW